MTVGGAYPSLVAMDLDATLWIPEMYELAGPPFKPCPKVPGTVLDGSGERVKLMADSKAILAQLATLPEWRDTQVAYVSRTEYPTWANRCLQLFQVAEGRSMHSVGAHMEIYPGCKQTHFRRIHERTKIPYAEMLFFDNERWNVREVAEMGVVSIHTPKGMTMEVWQRGLQEWRDAQG